MKIMKNIVLPALVLTIICGIITAALAGTNAITKDRIAELALQTAAEARQQVLSTAQDFEEQQLGDTVYHIGKDASGETAGYVFTTSSKGYGGAVEVMTGISADGKVTGVVLLDQNETPGLGQKATQSWFTERYLKDVPDNGFTVKKGSASADNEIEAITGATITSRAVTNAVNEAVDLYHQITEGGAR
ncbi:MAG: RnfABCDGE type electron transport complex subunit G [Clostridiales bacterium]|nr:RnfABCDGE type electron transport complex subunit G [Clostridiales bacterium]